MRFISRALKFFLFLLLLLAVLFRFFYSEYYKGNNRKGRYSREHRASDNVSMDIIEHCPPEGLTNDYRLMELNRLKNREIFPAESDFDKEATLEKMLAPGKDYDRWNSVSAAEVTGYVQDVMIGGVESCNCKAKDVEHRDTHIELVINPMESNYSAKIIVEVTPRIRNIMAAQGIDWSTTALRDKLLGRWVKVKGWLLFDFEHEGQDENTNPGGERNWRATCWEIHPVTSIEVVDKPRSHWRQASI